VRSIVSNLEGGEAADSTTSSTAAPSTTPPTTAATVPTSPTTSTVEARSPDTTLPPERPSEVSAHSASVDAARVEAQARAAAAAGTITVNSPGSSAAPGDIQFTGEFAVSQSVEHRVVYVVDVSGSTEEYGNDCNASGTVGPDDDLNGDGARGTVLDCEIAGVVALNSSLRQFPVKAGLVAFATGAVRADMTPGGGDDELTSTIADDDRNSVPDVQDVASSLGTGSVQRFTPRRSVGSGTDFGRAIAELTALVQAAGSNSSKPVQYTVYFLSDGLDSYPSSEVASLLTATSGARPPVVNTVSVGSSGSGCDTTSPLRRISDALAGTCQTSTPAQLEATLAGSKPAGLDRVEVTFAGATNVAEVDALGRWHTTFPGVAARPNPYDYTATAYLTDGSSTRATGLVTVADQGTRYVAIGDSYSSGNGLVPYYAKSKDSNGQKCARSGKAYAYSVTLPGDSKPAAQESDATVVLRACGGAVAADVVGRQQKENVPIQLSHLDSRTDLVTLTIGGNDAGFSSILAFCGMEAGFTNDCQTHEYKQLNSGKKLTLDEFAQIRLALLEIDLTNTFKQVRAAAPNATVVAADYNYLLPGANHDTCALTGFFVDSERDWVRTREREFGERVARAARVAGIHEVSILADSDGHEPCGKGEDWLYGFEFDTKASGSDDEHCEVKQIPVLLWHQSQTFCTYDRSFHPKERGTQEYGELISKYLENHSGPGADLNRAGLPVNPAPGGNGPSPLRGLTAPSSVGAIATAGGSSTAPPTADEIAAEHQLSGADLAQIAATSFEGARVSDLSLWQNLARPASCPATLTAVPGQVVVVSGSGFAPGARVTLDSSFAASTSELPAVVASDDGTAVNEVLLPASLNSSDVISFSLHGAGVNGGDHEADALVPVEAPDSSCSAALKAQGVLSTDGATLPASADVFWAQVGVTRLDGQPAVQPQSPSATLPPTSTTTTTTTTTTRVPAVVNDETITKATAQQPLAFTGQESLMLGLIAATAISLGATLMVWSRRTGRRARR
jgi:hypothetical protein